MTTSAGNFSIDASGNMTAVGTLSAANALFTVDSGGNVFATSFVTTSSRELKDRIDSLSPERAMALLDALEPVRFRWKQGDDIEHLGFIAEDVPPEVAPYPGSVSLMEIVAILTKVAKQQQAEIAEQQRLNRELRQRLEQLLPRPGKGGTEGQ